MVGVGKVDDEVMFMLFLDKISGYGCVGLVVY